MDPGIGTPSPMQGDLLFELVLQTLLQGSLHTAVMLLPLPAMKIRPKVLNLEGDALGVGNWKSQCHKGSLHQFNHSHFGPISPSLHGADDAGVATIALAIAIGHLFKQGSHEIFVIDIAQRLPPSRQGSILGQGDHLVSSGADSFGPSFGGGDPTFLQEGSGQSAQKSLALVSRFIEVRNAAAMSHDDGPE
jgi:hypothetical protein